MSTQDETTKRLMNYMVSDKTRRPDKHHLYQNVVYLDKLFRMLCCRTPPTQTLNALWAFSWQECSKDKTNMEHNIQRVSSLGGVSRLHERS